MSTVTNGQHVKIANLIKERLDWRNGTESFSGTASHWRSTTSKFGYLNDDNVNQYNRDIIAGGIDYIIFSYATPIAWRLTSGEWRVPVASYSVTTARHQSHVWSILRKLGIDTHFTRYPDMSPITGRPLKSRSHREQTIFTAA